MISLKNRVLLANGISVVHDSYAIRNILLTGEIEDHIKVLSSPAAQKYDEKYNKSIIYDERDIQIKPKFNDAGLIHFNDLIDILDNGIRDDTSREAHMDRLERELGYFIDNHFEHVLCSVHKLIERFKQDNVVWGVGRGSSCASYVLFVLEVHDVNPIKYDIDFREFSKEE